MNRGGRGTVCPWWYRVIRVAKLYGMSPEAVMDLPQFWIEAAFLAEAAEAWAEEEREKRQRHLQ